MDNSGRKKAKVEVTTENELQSYIRKFSYISQDDDRYHQGNSMENRIEPPLQEIDGDCFDRQRVIESFNQHKVEQQRCLVLGAGGIGQNVAMVLARLGVHSITFLDIDTYDASNLTRQLLGSLTDVGRSKVDTSRENIQFHNLRSLVKGLNCDVLSSWSTVVSCAAESDVIFNCVDVGQTFDYAVNALSKSFSIPLVQGQSAGWSMNAEFFSGQVGEVCGSCSTSLLPSFDVNEIGLKDVCKRLATWLTFKSTTNEEITSEDIYEFLYQDSRYRTSGATTKSMIHDSIKLLHNKSKTTNTSNNTISIDEFPQFIKNYYTTSLEYLLPSNITLLSDLNFLPRSKSIPTRYIGSWICPCLAVSTFMVSQFVNYITGPTDRNPPVSILFNMASGLTDIAESAIQCGFAEPPTLAKDKSCDRCITCNDANKLQLKSLFYSSSLVKLNPQSGGLFSAFSTQQQVQGLPSECRVEIRNGCLWRNIDDLGPDYANLVLDALPSIDLTACDDSTVPLVPLIPVCLHRPLLKGSLSDECNGVLAYGSGARSALFRDITQGEDNIAPAKWYRLKGCGMPDKGFTVQNLLVNPLQMIRGAGYIHTSSAELVMTHIIEQTLKPLGMASANKSIGRWEYSFSDNIEYPLVTRCCSIFQCLGDKRLGDHVLRGLELLLPFLAHGTPADLTCIQSSTLSALHGTGLLTMGGARNNEEGASDVELWEEFDPRLPRAILLYSGEGYNTDPTLFADLANEDTSIAGLGVPMLTVDNCSNDTVEYTTTISSIPKSYDFIWNQCCQTLRDITTANPALSIGYLLGYLYWRLGYECGLVGRALSESDIVWGSFQDSTGMHVNSHSNNLVLVDFDYARENRLETFLAPLDFDMAYTKQSARFGLSAEENLNEFDRMREFEMNEFGFNLSICQSNAPSTTSGVKSPAPVPSELSLTRLALRDTITRAWLTSIKGKGGNYLQDPHPPRPELREACQCLLKLALVLTSDVIA